MSVSFQFHKGTIKTIRSYCDSLKICYFNSIKVRLKPYNRDIARLQNQISIP